MLIQLLILLIIVGGALAILNVIPIDAGVKRIIYIVVFVIVAIWLIREFLPVAGLG